MPDINFFLFLFESMKLLIWSCGGKLLVLIAFLCPNDSDQELIFLTDGASKGVMQILNAIIRGEGDGVICLPK